MGAQVTPPEARDPTDILDSGEAGGQAIRGSALRVSGYVAGAVMTLISAPLMFRHLGIVDFGAYVTVLSLIGVVAGVTDAGLSAVAVREYAVRAGAEREQLMRDVLGARIVLTVAGVLAATLFAVVAGYRSELVLGTVVAGLGLVVAIVQTTYVVPLLAGLRLGWVTLTDLIRSAAGVIFVVALVLAGAGLVAFLAIPVLTGLFVLAITVVLVRGTVPLRPSFHPRRWWRLIRATLALAVATALGTLYFRLVIVVMSLIATGEVTGLFATSYRITELLAAMPAMLIGTTFPILSRAARDDDGRLRFAIQRLFEIAVIGGVWIALCTALGAELAVRFIGGDEAAPAADVLRLQALAIIPIFLTTTWHHALLSLDALRRLLIANTVAVITVLVLTLVLVPRYDAEGAAVAVVAAEVVLMSLSALFLHRTRKVLPTDLRVLLRVPAAAAAALGAGIAVGVHDIVRVAVATGVYFGVLALLRGIPQEAVDALRSWRRREPAR
jgi:O-antigen/teichoic acid export membrane protein